MGFLKPSVYVQLSGGAKSVHLYEHMSDGNMQIIEAAFLLRGASRTITITSFFQDSCVRAQVVFSATMENA